MPEHRPGTPSAYETLESFLWWDFAGASDWAQWAAKRGIARSAKAGRRSFEGAISLQETLRRLEAANNGAEPAGSDLAALNALIGQLDVRPELSPPGQIALTSSASGKDAPVASLLIMALNAMAEGIWSRFKLCRDPTCSASFYDASKSSTKVWCSMAVCGSRDKMRRLRSRQRA